MRASRVVVVTLPELVPGFQLAGVHVLSAGNLDQAQATVRQLFEDPDTGVIALHEPWLHAMPAALRVRLEGSVHPVVVALPSGEPVSAAARRRARLAELLERAVGFQLTFRPSEEPG